MGNGGALYRGDATRRGVATRSAATRHRRASLITQRRPSTTATSNALRVQSVFRLIKDYGLRTVDHGASPRLDRGQAVHGRTEDAAINLAAPKGMSAFILRLVGPLDAILIHESADDIRPCYCLFRLGP